jgi:sterol desaturase/sphingolipid hydroxylase (fatty acid hydroxylase superfamily)
MNDLIVAVGGFVIMGLLCALLERLWPEDGTQPAWRADSGTDVIYFLIRVGLSAVLVLASAATGGSIPERAGPVSSQPTWLQVIEFLLVTDLVSYWVHRIEHELPALWRIHAIHHSAERIDWLVAARNHPLELVLQKVASSVPLYFLGFPPALFAVLVPLAATYSLFQHANLTWSFGPFRYVLASPAFHRWHHSSQREALDKNYAMLFPFLDYLFGTAYFPRSVHPERFGLKGEVMAPGFWQHMIYPFRPAADSRPGSRASGQIEKNSPRQRAEMFAGATAIADFRKDVG